MKKPNREPGCSSVARCGWSWSRPSLLPGCERAEPAPCPLHTLPQPVLFPQTCDGGVGRQKRKFIQLESLEAKEVGITDPFRGSSRDWAEMRTKKLSQLPGFLTHLSPVFPAPPKLHGLLLGVCSSADTLPHTMGGGRWTQTRGRDPALEVAFIPCLNHVLMAVWWLVLRVNSHRGTTSLCDHPGSWHTSMGLPLSIPTVLTNSKPPVLTRLGITARLGGGDFSGENSCFGYMHVSTLSDF